MVARGPQLVAEIYYENAKVCCAHLSNARGTHLRFVQELLAGSLNQPTLDTLHCVMLLAWSEYKGGHIHGMST